jgi:AP-2 complex subunit alpha
MTKKQSPRKMSIIPAPVAKDTSNSNDVSSDIMNSLAGLDLNSPSALVESPTTLSSPSPFFPPQKPPTAPRLTGGPNIDRWFEKLTYSADGVLYEDVQIQIGIKSRFQGHLGQIAIYMGNKVSAPLTSFTATLHVHDTEALSANFAKLPPSTIAPRTQTQLLLHVECKKMFTAPPIMSISFLAGAQQSVALQLPVVVTKFFEHVTLGQAEFFERWKLIGGPPRESQSIFPINLNEAGNLDITKNREVVSGHHLNLLDGIDPNPSNLVAAGVLHTSVDGKVGCLLRLEPNRDAKVGSLEQPV